MRLVCDQMCGKGHFSMRGVIIVETQQDYDKWLAAQKPEYFKHFLTKIQTRQQQQLIAQQQ